MDNHHVAEAARAKARELLQELFKSFPILPHIERLQTENVTQQNGKPANHQPITG